MNKYNFRDNGCALIGDTHSTTVTNQLLVSNKKFLKDYDVVHIGDGGWGFGSPAYALDNAKSWCDLINKTCKELNIVLYHIIGNHDNPDVWKFPNLSNLIFVQSGDVGVFPNGKQVLFIGGGVSIDRYTRKEGIDYWKNEVTPFLDTVEKCDVVFSHDCPEHFNHATKSLVNNFGWYIERDITLLTDCERQRYNISDICKRAEAKKIFGGHFHNNIQEEIDGVKYRCLNINELYEFRTD